MAYKAGLKLNMLIAERIGGYITIDYRWYDGTTKRMLWHPTHEPPKGDDFQRLPDGRLCAWDAIPNYSTDIAAAWEIVEWISQPARSATMANTRFMQWWRAADLWADTAKEAALEICNAALQALDNVPIDINT